MISAGLALAIGVGIAFAIFFFAIAALLLPVAFRAAGVAAPWLLWLVFLMRNTDRNYGATQR